MDILALLAMWGALIVIAAMASGGLLTWIRAEFARMRADTWQFIEENPRLFTSRYDERCRRMAIRQRSASLRMRREGVMPRVAISSACLNHSPRFQRTPR